MPNDTNNSGGGNGGGGLDGLAAIVLLVIGALSIVWAGAQLAARLGSGSWIPGGVQDTANALVHLPSHGSAPAEAWPAAYRSLLPGPGLYWGSTIAIAVVVVVIGAQIARLVSSSGPAGLSKRTRLGVDTQARLSRRKDLRTILVRRAGAPGRLVVGRVHGRLVATEDRHLSPSRNLLARSRQGDRMGVVVVGPTRCGKTANLVASVLEWPGPAILSSVKDDMIKHTLAHRSRLGEVKVFDPTRQTNVPEELRARWSPLREAHTATGAQRAARAMSEIMPTGDQSNGGFWNASADQLLWPTLFAARWAPEVGLPGGLEAMVGWLATYNSTGVIEICDELIARNVSATATRDAMSARQVMIGFRDGEPKVVQSIYQTAQPMLRAMQDPQVMDATAHCDIDFEWLCDPNQANTLYVSGPTHDQKRLELIFGGLFGDLLAQQAYERANEKGPLQNPLLVLMDEAANSPCTWLPHVASTCAGVGVVLVTVWQDLSQMKSAYGTLAGSVLNNHGTKIFFAGQSDPETQNYVTAQCGAEQVESRTITHGKDASGKQLQITSREVQLVPGHVQREMKPGHAVLIHGTLPPAHLRWRRWWKDRTLRQWHDGKGKLPDWMPLRKDVVAVPDDESRTVLTVGGSSPLPAEEMPTDPVGIPAIREDVLSPTPSPPRPSSPSAAPMTAADLAARAGLSMVPPPPRR